MKVFQSLPPAVRSDPVCEHPEAPKVQGVPTAPPVVGGLRGRKLGEGARPREDAGLLERWCWGVTGEVGRDPGAGSWTPGCGSDPAAGPRCTGGRAWGLEGRPGEADAGLTPCWPRALLASRLAGSPSLQSCPLPPPAAHARLSCFFPLFLFPVYTSVSFFSLTLLFFFLPFFLF